jgi:hypothetical protein
LPVAPSAVTPTAPLAAPNVIEAAPSVGSAAGGATVRIIGTGFRPGMTAMFGDIRVTGRFHPRDTSYTTFYTEAPAHAAGSVDLIVTNPDGQAQRLVSGYTYAPQESFDPDGVWSGFSVNGTDTLVEFVIRDRRLVSAACAYDVRVPFAVPDFPAVESGEFSVRAEGGATISGRIVSASELVGVISLPPCTTVTLPWRADRTSN